MPLEGVRMLADFPCGVVFLRGSRVLVLESDSLGLSVVSSFQLPFEDSLLLTRFLWRIFRRPTLHPLCSLGTREGRADTH